MSKRGFTKMMRITSNHFRDIHSIWFPDNEKRGPVGTMLMYVSRIMSSYNVIDSIHQEFRIKDIPNYWSGEWSYLPLSLEERDGMYLRIKASPKVESIESYVDGDRKIKIFKISGSGTKLLVLLDKTDSVDYIFTTSKTSFWSWVVDDIWRQAGPDGVVINTPANPHQDCSWLKRTQNFKAKEIALTLDGDLLSSVGKERKIIRAFLNRGKTRRILLYGPPGGGKSLLAHRIASEFMGNKIIIVGCNAGFEEESLRLLTSVDGGAAIIFEDADRNGELQKQMTYLDSSDAALIFATVNAIASVDAALVRNGRFDRVIYVGLPTRAEIQAFLGDQLPIIREGRLDMLVGLTYSAISELLENLDILGDEVFEEEILRLRFQCKISDEKATSDFLGVKQNATSPDTASGPE